MIGRTRCECGEIVERCCADCVRDACGECGARIDWTDAQPASPEDGQATLTAVVDGGEQA